MNLKENDHEIEAAFGRLDFIFFISNASEVRANTPKPKPKQSDSPLSMRAKLKLAFFLNLFEDRKQSLASYAHREMISHVLLL